MPKKNKKKVMKSAKRKRKDDMAVSASPVVTSNKDNVQYLENPVKPDYDKNEYRAIQLCNGLKVALVATQRDEDSIDPGVTGGDPQKVIRSAACYLCLNVGTFNNSQEVPGVSSVVSGTFRHSLFESGLQLELREYWEETIFRFYVDQDVFYAALNIFALPFISLAPKRHHVKIERRMLENDEMDFSERFPEIRDTSLKFMNLATTRHPIRTVNNDFRASLRQMNELELYREVMKFCKHYYSANRMTVVLRAGLPLDTLETYAIKCFSNIPNRGLPLESFEPHNFVNSFDNAKFRRIWTVSADERDFFRYRMDVHWIMPPSRWLYKTKSLEYLTWTFSELGAGTLRDYLIKKEWAEHVIAKVRKTPPWNTSLYSTFTISISLSNEGNNRIIEILDTVYSYINLLKREGPQQRIYDKIRMNEEAKFRYVDYSDYDVSHCFDDDPDYIEDDFGDRELRIHVSNEHPYMDEMGKEWACVRVENMHLYESADYITGPLLYYEYDPVSITTCMELMTPAKGCIFVNNEEFRVSFKTDEPSDNQATDGSMEIPEYLIERWKTIEPFPEFKLPEINRFWPDDLSIIDTPKTYSKYPIIVHSDDISETWYQFDPKIRAPWCKMNFCYVSPLPLESVENAVMFHMFEAVLNVLLHDELKSAKNAGLFGTIVACASGLLIRVRGLTQKFPLLIETIAKCVPESHYCLTEKLFEQERFEMYKKFSSDFFDSEPIAQDILDSILTPGHWSAMDKWNTLPSITFDKLRHFMKQFTDHVYIKCLVEGNISELTAIEIARKGVMMSKCEAFVPDTMPQRRINEIPRDKHCCKIKINTSVEKLKPFYLNYYQFDTFSIKQAVFIDVLKAIFRYPRFAKLRKMIARGTKLIRIETNDDCGVNNFLFLYYGDDNPTINTDEIKLMDERLLKKFVRAFTDDDWQCLKQILMHSKERKIEKLRDFNDNWHEIIESKYTFDRRSRELDVITNLEAKDFRDWITHIAENDLHARKLSIVVVGSLSDLELDAITNSVNQGRKSGNHPEIPPLKIEYMTESVEEKGNTSNIYVTDLLKFKSEVESWLKKTVELNNHPMKNHDSKDN